MKINVERNDIKEWMDILSGASAKSGPKKVWGSVLSLLAVPARRRVSVNLYKINKYSKEGDNIVVPGKVLSVGAMDHSVTISAVEYSKEALDQLNSAKCKVIGISDMLGQKKVNIIR